MKIVLITIGVIILIIVYMNIGKNKNNDRDKIVLSTIHDKLVQVDSRARYLTLNSHSNEAYIIDKKDIYMCVLNDDGSYYNDNVLMYIGLHELAHALIPHDTQDHPQEFTDKFHELKSRASSLGLYDPTIPFPSKYCGKNLKYY
jgi:hypothetical protein